MWKPVTSAGNMPLTTLDGCGSSAHGDIDRRACAASAECGCIIWIRNSREQHIEVKCAAAVLIDVDSDPVVGESAAASSTASRSNVNVHVTGALLNKLDASSAIINEGRCRNRSGRVRSAVSLKAEARVPGARN